MSIGGLSANGGMPQPISAAQWQQVLQTALSDGGPVNDVKMTSDQSGKSGDADYFSALGYDA